MAGVQGPAAECRSPGASSDARWRDPNLTWNSSGALAGLVGSGLLLRDQSLDASADFPGVIAEDRIDVPDHALAVDHEHHRQVVDPVSRGDRPLEAVAVQDDGPRDAGPGQVPLQLLLVLVDGHREDRDLRR